MLILHVSDIHFRTPDCTHPDLDPERPYRTKLIQDVQAMVSEHGSVNAILVGGDIAFKGDPQEYTAAYAWLTELAAAAGCPIGRVFVVPGNHDVDRTTIRNSPATSDTQNAIFRERPDARERTLRARIMDPATSRALLLPLEAYNDFAKVFNCQVYLPEKLYWKQDLDLGGGVSLRIHGLTSTLLSGKGGENDTRDSLYLSQLQTTLDPVDDVINLVLCHHPPDWFMDQDTVDEQICNRAKIQMFGHKHRQRITRETQYVRFSAGAVNPDRNEAGWLPGYNLVKVSLVGSGAERTIRLDAHLRQWQSNPEMFRPVTPQEGGEVFVHHLSFPQLRVQANASQQSPPTTAGEAQTQQQDLAPTGEAAMGDPITRNLISRFWGLRHSQRRDLALSMELITAADLGLPEPERYGRALIRASEQGRLEELSNKVTELEQQG